jgi:hypothetical protein
MLFKRLVLTQLLLLLLLLQNDPTIPEGAGPELSPELAQELQQDESSGGPACSGEGGRQTAKCIAGLVWQSSTLCSCETAPCLCGQLSLELANMLPQNELSHGKLNRQLLCCY